MNGTLLTNHSHNTTHGWVPQTNGRGTLDILWSCIITIFLCCWTSVFANIPAMMDTPLERLRDKFNVACLGILGPEFLFTLALGQWISARRSVQVSDRYFSKTARVRTDVFLYQLFRGGGYPDWTMKHAFFADMGGFVLQSPGWKAFPLESKQLYYMVSQGYLAYPNIAQGTIDDKNKADGVARYATKYCCGRA